MTSLNWLHIALWVLGLGISLGFLLGNILHLVNKHLTKRKKK